MADAPQKPTIIIAEDDSGVASALEQMLRSQYDVRIFDNGKQALAALEAISRPVVMITDYGLASAPDGTQMDGFQLIEQARAKFSGIPMIMLTADYHESTQKRAAALGVQFLFKPATRDEILGAVAAAQRQLEGPRGPTDHAKREHPGQKRLFE